VKYKVVHTTQYSYSDPAPVCHNLLHLAPRKLRRQLCDDQRLLINPAPVDLRRRDDYFGNPIHYFSIQETHRRLTITATSRIEILPADPVNPNHTPPWETVRDQLPADRSPQGLAHYQFAFDSPAVPRAAEFADYARASFAPGRPLLEAAVHLTARIHKDFTYDVKATTIHTPLAEVFAQRRGVCQDFAHVEIAALRSLGLAARYVSGYLRTIPPPGRPRLIGADASHAWLSLYCGEAGWIDVDPTNNLLPQTDHITVAWGRDYHDVCPVQGVFIGGGQHAMSVSVDVTPL
jgi:transglutaminase-like putative cysteine protease